MDETLLTHFRRIAYLVLLYDWIKGKYFDTIPDNAAPPPPEGNPIPSTMFQLEAAGTQLQLMEPCDAWKTYTMID